ncbi:MAG: TolC family protein, partial [Pirellulales bacterium]|nr:TolC family protein [Pirellulales bacterium]
KLQLQRQVVASQIDQAQAELAVNRLRVQTDVRAAFQSALVAQQRLDLVKQLQDIARKSLESVEAMVAARESSRLELLQAQTALQQAVLAVETAAATLRGARARLTSVVAAGPLPSLPLEGELDDHVNGMVLETIQSELMSSSPQLASRAAEIQRAQNSLRLACAGVVPNINAQLGVGFDAATDDTYGSIQVSVPLPIVNRNQGSIRQFRAEITESDRALRQTELGLQQQLATAFQSYEVARLRRERLEDEILPRAEETLQLSVEAFNAGEASFLELLTVQRTLFTARLTLLDATAQAAQSANLINGYLLSGALDAI